MLAGLRLLLLLAASAAAYRIAGRVRPSADPGTPEACVEPRVVTVKAQKEGDGLSAKDAVFHAGWFAGINNPQLCHNPTHSDDQLPPPPGNCREWGSAQAQLMRPQNVVVKNVGTHYLSCTDSRAEYAVLGTPGGDLGEFILGLAAVEEALHHPLPPDGVLSVLNNYLSAMSGWGKSYFYMHTDGEAENAWYQAASVVRPWNPLDADGRLRLVKASSVPDHIGCSHLRALVEEGDDYGVRPSLAASAIEAFVNVYFDIFSPHRQHLMFVTLHGDAQPDAVFNVYSSEVCKDYAAVVVPRIHSASPSSPERPPPPPEPGLLLQLAERSSARLRGTAAAQATAGSRQDDDGDEVQTVAAAKSTYSTDEKEEDDPNVGSSVMVNHYVAAMHARSQLAAFLASQFDLNGQLLAAKMNRIAKQQWPAVVARDAEGKPQYVVSYFK
eukprot:PLAT8819.1.p1 GENE.PLAT8819.1~~PLAT8819.1.p1  ORF type:complete len:440 (+),score=213.43 PLAT8819.1:22-1341(+)